MPSAIIVIATIAEIGDNSWHYNADQGALTSLNLASKSIGGYKDKESPFKFHATPEGKAFVLGLCRWSNALLISIGPAAIADAIKYMGAMTSLNLASNQLYAEGTALLAAALKGNQIMTTELNISSNSMTYGSAWGDMSGIIALADATPDIRTLTKLDINYNNIEQGEPLRFIAELCNTKGGLLLSRNAAGQMRWRCATVLWRSVDEAFYATFPS
jgi:hypothetical protein